MSRVQLALRVGDLQGSIEFYSTLFGTEPAKRRPGYANFAVTEPPLKLVLLEGETDQTTCCYAVQDKVWVHGPGREPWEIYTVTGDSASYGTDGPATSASGCCAPAENSAEPAA